MDGFVIESARCVKNNLPWFYKETHHQKAMMVELCNLGVEVYTECLIPTIYTDALGKNHVICADRADIVASHADQHALIELKRATQIKPSLLTDTRHQICRYLQNARVGPCTTFTDAYAVIFTEHDCTVYKHTESGLIIIATHSKGDVL